MRTEPEEDAEKRCGKAERGVEGTERMSGMRGQYTRPAEIEARSMELIGKELRGRGFHPDPSTEDIVKRVIHATADFDFAETLFFTEGAAEAMRSALLSGASIVTDTNMAFSGISRKRLGEYGGKLYCFMGDPDVAAEAARRSVTRATVSMERAAALPGPLLFAVGNAPTALERLCGLVREGRILPAGIIAVPVGFVNVVEAKEEAMQLKGIPLICACGRKGGSTVAAAICNALLYGIRRT